MNFRLEAQCGCGSSAPKTTSNPIRADVKPPYRRIPQQEYEQAEHTPHNDNTRPRVHARRHTSRATRGPPQRGGGGGGHTHTHRETRSRAAGRRNTNAHARTHSKKHEAEQQGDATHTRTRTHTEKHEAEQQGDQDGLHYVEPLVPLVVHLVDIHHRHRQRQSRRDGRPYHHNDAREPE